MIRIGTRKSKLALIQTELVKTQILKYFPNEKIEIVHVVTHGDKVLDKPLGEIGGKGVFTKEIEEKLLDKTIDIAVHSAKDVPMELADGLCLGAVLLRDDNRDVILKRKETKKIGAGSIIGTSSLRREIQIKQISPDVTIKSLRGNVGTRIDKLKSGEYDAIILAAAGLKRLGLDNDTELDYIYPDEEKFISAAGQGILAIECRNGDLKDVMAVLDDRKARICLEAEREFLKCLDGSCNAPCGAHCTVDEHGFYFRGMYAYDGKTPKYAVINEKTGNRFVVIIDEWDVLIRDEAQNQKIQEEYIGFLRRMFKGTEPTKYIALAFLTGILPIKKLRTQSALNNFSEFTMLDSRIFSEYTGFTEEEVRRLCEKYGRDFLKVKRLSAGKISSL